MEQRPGGLEGLGESFEARIDAELRNQGQAKLVSLPNLACLLRRRCPISANRKNQLSSASD